MLGDWGGKRTELLEKGYDFKLEYVGEAAANLDGGYDDDKTCAKARRSASRAWTSARSKASS